MEILERLSEKFANRFDARNLSNIAWSCAALDYHPSRSILTSVCDNLIAMTVTARAKATETETETAEEEEEKRAEPPGGRTGRAGVGGAEGITRGTPPPPITRNGGDPDPPHGNHHHLPRRRHPPRPPPSAQALSNCLWALTTLRHTALATKFGAVVAEVTLGMTDQFDPNAAGVGGAFVPQTIANLLWSYATLRYHPGDELMDTFAAMVTRHARHFKPQELSNVVWSYATLSHYPGDDFMRVAEIEMSHHAAYCDPQGLANNILSVATFQHSDAAARAGLHAFMSSLDDDAALRKVDEFNLQSLSNSIWGISVVGCFTSKFYRRLWERCAAEIEFTSRTKDKDSFMMMYHGYLLMKAVAPMTAGTMPTPDWLHTDAARLWRQQTATTSSSVSSFQRVFSQHLTEMGVRHELEPRTEDETIAMDIGLMDRRIAFECDGPSHFCVNEGLGSMPLSRNHARATLLAERGWHAVSVPWHEWAASVDKGKEECQALIRRSTSAFGNIDDVDEGGR